MSDESKKDPLDEHLEKEALRERKKKEVLEKELRIRERRADTLIEKIDQNDKDLEIARITNYGCLSEEEVRELQRENTEYLNAAKNKMPFITETFADIVPFFMKNLILIGAPTGAGKSTTVANIIRELIGKKNPVTNKWMRILVLTNEEKSEDVYNRVTCLIEGWKYTNHDRFNQEQIAFFNKNIELLRRNGMLTVIDDQYGGALGTTTSIEGICQVFDNLIEKKDFYDVVIMDYYQNCTESKRNVEMDEFKVQAALVRRLDKYKNVYPAPIVVMAQVREPDQAKTPFKIRIEGRKTIFNVCTCALEMTAKPEDYCTEWRIHKSRFTESIGRKVVTGYEKGRYVEHTEEFQANVAKWKAVNETKEFDKSVGMPEVEEKEEVKGKVENG